jgi:hypothetical protein
LKSQGILDEGASKILNTKMILRATKYSCSNITECDQVAARPQPSKRDDASGF